MTPTSTLRDDQQLIFDLPPARKAGTDARKRHLLGGIVEDIVCQAFKARRFGINSNSKACPDLLFSSGDYGEVKSLTKEGIVFEHRMRKDLEVDRQAQLSTGNNLYYVYLEHSCEFKGAETDHDLATGVLATASAIHVIKCSTLWALRSRATPAALYYQADGPSKGKQKVPAFRFTANALQSIAFGGVQVDVTPRWHTMSATKSIVAHLPIGFKGFPGLSERIA